MRLEHLLYLIEVSKSPSITAAAEKLYMSHQTLSAAIKTLEKEFDVKLIERDFTGVSLTADGKYLVKIAQEFYQKLQQFGLTSIQNKNTIQGKLRISGSRMALESLLPKIIANFYLDYPKIELITSNLKPEDVVNSYEKREVDLAFMSVYGPSHQTEFIIKPGIHFQPCLKLTSCIEVLKTDPIAKLKSITLQQLNQQCIIYNCPEQLVDDNFNHWPFDYIKGRKTIYQPSNNIYLEMLRGGCGAGISILSKSRPLNKISDDFAYIPIQDKEVNWWLGYLFKENHNFSELANCFLSHLKNYYPLA